ncbi:NAD(P)-binding protein [Streptomyces sp. NPDC059255]|uniref:NAD(P)-binding protein n=1 Tax=Streptomyces sp. NPDC059255 TaxID=3346793 RepID=UPI0036D11B23
MEPTAFEVDYLIVGAGAMGLAFADTLVAETDATVAVVDRYGRPGGHWTVAYPFVRLHQPSAFYGVNSRELGTRSLDTDGGNEGLHELASVSEILTYFKEVMHRTLLPTGRVSYHPMTFYDGPEPTRPDVHRFHSLVADARYEVTVRRRVVDSTYMNVTVPAMVAPKYEVGPGVRLITPNELPSLSSRPSHYTVVGAGKTGIDAVLWLLEHAVDPADITWIMPRDAWLFDRVHFQPGARFAASNAAAVKARMRAVTRSHTVKELFQHLEECGSLLRLSPDVTPTSFRCATVTRTELEQLRRVDDIVRQGRVVRIGDEAVELEQAVVPAVPGTLYVDCTADGLEQRPAVPVFDGSRITLQSVVPCQQVFSAALTAHVEASYDRDETKNWLCAASSHPHTDLDWLRAHIDTAERQLRWSAEPAVRDWIETSRVSMQSAAALTPEQQAEFHQGLAVVKVRLQELLAQDSPAEAPNSPDRSMA